MDLVLGQWLALRSRTAAEAARSRQSSQWPPAAPSVTHRMGGMGASGREEKASVIHEAPRPTMRRNANTGNGLQIPICANFCSRIRTNFSHKTFAKERKTTGKGRKRKAPGTRRRARQSSSKKPTSTHRWSTELEIHWINADRSEPGCKAVNCVFLESAQMLSKPDQEIGVRA